MWPELLWVSTQVFDGDQLLSQPQVPTSKECFRDLMSNFLGPSTWERQSSSPLMLDSNPSCSGDGVTQAHALVLLQIADSWLILPLSAEGGAGSHGVWVSATQCFSASSK